MTEVQRLFALNLKRVRNRNGLTQEKLAELCGMSLNHLGAIEGARRFPSPDIFQRIADALQIEPHRLLVNPNAGDDLPDIQLLERYTDYLMEMVS